MIEILGRTIGDRSSEDNDQHEETASETILVQTTHRNVSRWVILDHPDVPQIGDVYSTPEGTFLDLTLKRRRLRPKDDSDILWELELEYSTKTEKKEEAEEDEPLDRRPEVSIDFEIYQVTVQGAIKVENVGHDPNRSVNTLIAWDKALVNSAGEPFDPQPERDEARPVLNVTVNEQNLNLQRLSTFANTVNQTPWLGGAPRTWKLGGPRVVRVREKNQSFWQITTSFTFAKDTWDLQLLNQGTYFLDLNDDKRPFIDEEGNRRVGLLNEDGQELAAANDPTFSRYRVYRESDFNLLFTDSILTA